MYEGLTNYTNYLYKCIRGYQCIKIKILAAKFVNTPAQILKEGNGGACKMT